MNQKLALIAEFHTKQSTTNQSQRAIEKPMLATQLCTNCAQGFTEFDPEPVLLTSHKNFPGLDSSARVHTRPNVKGIYLQFTCSGRHLLLRHISTAASQTGRGRQWRQTSSLNYGSVGGGKRNSGHRSHRTCSGFWKQKQYEKWIGHMLSKFPIHSQMPLVKLCQIHLDKTEPWRCICILRDKREKENQAGKHLENKSELTSSLTNKFLQSEIGGHTQHSQT